MTDSYLESEVRRLRADMINNRDEMLHEIELVKNQYALLHKDLLAFEGLFRKFGEMLAIVRQFSDIEGYNIYGKITKWNIAPELPEITMKLIDLVIKINTTLKEQGLIKPDVDGFVYTGK